MHQVRLFIERKLDLIFITFEKSQKMKIIFLLLVCFSAALIQPNIMFYICSKNTKFGGMVSMDEFYRIVRQQRNRKRIVYTLF